MYVTIPLLYKKEMEETQFQALLSAPRENHFLKRGSKRLITVEETLRVTKKLWGPCSWIYQAARSLKRDETEIKPSLPLLKSVTTVQNPAIQQQSLLLTAVFQSQASQQGYNIMQSEK